MTNTVRGQRSELPMSVSTKKICVQLTQPAPRQHRSMRRAVAGTDTRYNSVLHSGNPLAPPDRNGTAGGRVECNGPECRYHAVSDQPSQRGATGRALNS